MSTKTPKKTPQKTAKKATMPLPPRQGLRPLRGRRPELTSQPTVDPPVDNQTGKRQPTAPLSPIISQTARRPSSTSDSDSSYSGSTEWSSISWTTPSPTTSEYRQPEQPHPPFANATLLNCGGISDTPPERLIPRSRHPSDIDRREYHLQSVSRQVYIWRTLTSLQRVPMWNTACTLASMVMWRTLMYPIRIYFRPTLFCALAWLLACSYFRLSVAERGSELLCVEQANLLGPGPAVMGMLTWLSLHLWDMFRGVQYVRGNPNFQAGWASGVVIRALAILRPLAPIVILACSFLARWQRGMAVEGYLQLLDVLFNESLTLCLLVGAVEIVVYFIVRMCEIVLQPVTAMGGYKADGRPAVPMHRVQRWDVEVVLPWSTIVAWLCAVMYCVVYVRRSVASGSWVGGMTR